MGIEEKQANDKVAENAVNGKHKKVRLHRRYTVYNINGKKIGYVKNKIYYSLSDKIKGKFFKEKDEIVLRKLPAVATDTLNPSFSKFVGYLRENDEIHSKHGRKLLVLERKSNIVPIIILIIILTLLASILCMRQVFVSRDYIPTLFVTELDGKPWSETEEITVFENGEYHGSKIYPGIVGEYSFKLENRNPDALYYSISFSENNDYNINMAYRLKMNGEYLNGSNYKPVEELSFEEIVVEKNCNDIFTLEWTWIEGDNDTEIGMSNATYTLIVRVDAYV